MAKRKKDRFSLKEFFADAWLDLKFKLIIISSVFIAFVIVLVLVVQDMNGDREMLASKANKYETYIDQLLLKKFTQDELKDMSRDELKLAIDMVIDEESSKVVNAPKLGDFILPVEDENYSTMFKLTREPKNSWSSQDINPYWIDLDGLDIDGLDERNFEYLKIRLKDIN